MCVREVKQHAQEGADGTSLRHNAKPGSESCFPPSRQPVLEEDSSQIKFLKYVTQNCDEAVV